MNIVFSFEYENNEYLVIKNGNQYIPCKRIKGIIKYEITDEELSLINYVFNQIKTTDNRLKLSDFEYKDNVYQHLYDKTNNYHIFYNLDGSEIVDKKIFSELNMLFNYQNDILYIDNNKKENKLKRLVKFGKKVILVLATSTALISPLSKLTPIQAQEIKAIQITEDIVVEDLSNEEKIENLKKLIMDNKNLKDEDKEFLLSRFDMIEDNIDVIKYDTISFRFKNLNKIDKEYIGTLAGEYSQGFDTITMTNFTDDKKTYDTAYTHEFFHALQIFPANLGFLEPVNDIFVNEYQGIIEQDDYRNYSWGYNAIKPYIYTLMEIINPESMKYCNFTGDVSKIKEELMNIIDDEAKFYELIGYYNALTNGIQNNASNNAFEYIFDKLEAILKEYYIKKYNSPIEENFEIMSNLHKDAVLQVLKEDNEDIEDIKLNKMYFNSKYINNNLKAQVLINNELIDVDNNILKGKSNELKNIINNQKVDYSLNFKMLNLLNSDFIELNSNTGIDIEYSESSGKFTVIHRVNNEFKEYELSSEYINKVVKKMIEEKNKYNKKNKDDFRFLVSINNGILSLYSNYKTSAYNIDLNTGEKVKLSKLIKASNYSKGEIYNQIENDIYEFSESQVDNLQKYIGEFSDDKYNTLVDIVSEKGMEFFYKKGIKTAHLDKDGNLAFFVKINSINSKNNKIGKDFFKDIIIIGEPYTYEKGRESFVK